ncbi:MAG: SRPBCC family protein [Deltaproteobacteria bacterium]|nr:SRPBCC family protein [Deltaproteobacteria bacterium]
MPTIRVEETVEVPRDALFAVLLDHEGYGRFRGVRKCELIRTGRPERNGLGAVRRVHLGGPVVLDEEIVAYDAPNRYEYLIRRARPLPIRHTLGRVELESLHENQTKVTWTSTFEFPLPIIGGPMGKRVAARMTEAFRATIHKAAQLAVQQAA